MNQKVVMVMEMATIKEMDMAMAMEVMAVQELPLIAAVMASAVEQNMDMGTQMAIQFKEKL